VRNWLTSSTVTKLSLKLAQEEQKRSKRRKEKLSLSYGWQRDLVEFSIRYRIGGFIFKDRRFQPLTHSSVYYCSVFGVGCGRAAMHALIKLLSRLANNLQRRFIRGEIVQSSEVHELTGFLVFDRTGRGIAFVDAIPLLFSRHS
jgi:hypothetical protein